jgi:hypothetical protein
VRPAGLDEIVMLLRGSLFTMSWDDYLAGFAPVGADGFVWAPDLSWVVLVYFTEFSVSFRPRWEAVRSITVAKALDGRSGDAERTVIGLDEADAAWREWDSERSGLRGESGAARRMAGVVSALSGVPIEETG